MENLAVSIPGGIRTGNHGNDKGGNAALPQGSHCGDIHHAAIGIVIADRPVFLPTSDGRQRAAAARTCPDISTRYAQTGLRRYLLHALIEVKEAPVLLPDNVYPGLRHGVQDFLVISVLQISPSHSAAADFPGPAKQITDQAHENRQRPAANRNFRRRLWRASPRFYRFLSVSIMAPCIIA